MWRCFNCNYSQDFEMTAESARRIFPEMPNLKAGQCPSCGSQLEESTAYNAEMEKDNQLIWTLTKIVGEYGQGKISREDAVKSYDKLLSKRETELGLAKASVDGRKLLQLSIFDAWDKYKEGLIDDIKLNEVCHATISGLHNEAWKLLWFRETEVKDARNREP